MSAIVAQAGGASLGCEPARDDLGTFRDAIDFVLHQRESVSGGACIGGFEELGDLAVSHMTVSAVALLAALVVALPIGLWLGHIGRGEFLAVSVSNIGRAVPALALLAFFVAFLGIGFANVAVVLALLAIPAILTNTYVGVRQADADTVAAARGVGLTELQIVRQIELPLAVPTIFAGIRLSAVAVVATATIAPLANVQSLGNPILEPQNYGGAGQLGAAIVVALITLATDGGLGVVQRYVTPPALRRKLRQPRVRRSPLAVPPTTEISR